MLNVSFGFTQEAALFIPLLSSRAKYNKACCWSWLHGVKKKAVESREKRNTVTISWNKGLFFALTFMKPTCLLSSRRWWEWAVQTYTIVAAPASNGVGCISHLLQGLGTQVAQLPQAAVVEHPRADPAGVQVVGGPHLTHVTHLVTRGLTLKETKRSRVKRSLLPVWSIVWFDGQLHLPPIKALRWAENEASVRQW